MADTQGVEAASIPPFPHADPYGRPEGRPQLGSLLLRDGVITVEQLEAALAQKEAEGGRLGEILLRYNVATATAIAKALAEQYGFEFIELSRFDLVPAATSLLPENVSRRLSALPIAFDEDGTVIVAVTDPTDVMASDDLRLALGLQIRFVVVSVSDLGRTLDRCFRANVHVEMEADVVVEDEEEAVEDITRGRRHRRARDQADQPDHRQRDRRGSLGHPLRAAAACDGRPRPDRRRHAQGRRSADRADARRHQPPQDHGRARHRRPPQCPGRPRLDPLRRPSRRPSHRGAADDVRREGRAQDPPPRLRPARDLRSRDEPRGRGGADAGAEAAVRRRPHRRPDGLRQDDDALRGARVPQRRRALARDDRGSGREPDSRDHAGRGERSRRSDLCERPADDAPLGPRRRPDRRGARRGDGADRDPGGDDRPPRADDAAHAQRGQLDRPAPRHGRRPVADRDLDQLHRRAAARAQALRPLPRGVHPDRGREDRGRAQGRPPGRRDALSRPRLRASAPTRATTGASRSTR